jgi:predicted nucleotide-binding protein
MYYHVIIETSEKDPQGKNKKYFELDKTDLTEIERCIVSPFLKSERIHFDGYFIEYNDIRRLLIVETQKTTKDLVEYEEKLRRSYNDSWDFISFRDPIDDILNNKNHTIDITKSVFDRVKTSSETKKMTTNNLNKIDLSKIFIVHGRQESEIKVARLIEKLGFKPIILHEQANGGKTIIEKLEESTDVGYAIVLYTPCDKGMLANEVEPKRRARQNVVFEHGYLIGKLGREKVCALVQGDVETPNDISGVVYIPLDTHEAWKMKVAKELKAAGYTVDMNRL